MGLNKITILVSIMTATQAVIQLTFTGLALAQYFCVIDFLRGYPTLLFIRILYFSNPICGQRINIGRVIDGISEQAFVLITEEPLTTTRLFYIHTTNLAINVLLLVTSAVLMVGAARGSTSRLVRWPWLTVMVCASIVDIVATVSFINDSFYIRTLADAMTYIGGRVSGVGNANINMVWAAWTMTLIYSRLGVLFILNIIFQLVVVIKENIPVAFVSDVTILPKAAPLSTVNNVEEERDIELDFFTLPRVNPEQVCHDICISPLPKFNVPQSTSLERQGCTHLPKTGYKKVQFPDALLSLPQRLDNIMADRRHLEPVADIAATSTESKESETSAVQPADSQPDLAESSKDQTIQEYKRERRGTSSELQGQLPWAYYPAPAFRMRDRLPADEELPPVPLPDYSATRNKTAVHRAPSFKWEHREKSKSSTKGDVFYY